MEKDYLTSSFIALRDKLHRSAIAFLKDDEDAKDAMQDAFLNLWKHGDMKSDAEARNKLFTALRNICIDKIRRTRSIHISEADYDRVEVQPEPYEDVGRLESLLTSGLTDIQKRIYILVTRDGMEYEAVAARLDMSASAVRMSMSRARKKIRENYKKLNR
ncbi:MAG: sigma-70 family RNA polymerase sigma factor [Muribaculaceae bacterium]|nr:sigma-70 family RNA polymerase sigma factor [Muribaculaceae bacterium]